MQTLKSFRVWLYLRMIWLRKRLPFRKVRSVFKWLKGQLISLLGIWIFSIHALSRTFRNETTQLPVRRNLLIIVPKDYKIETSNFNGGTKDIQSMLEQMTSLGISFEIFSAPRKTTHALYVLLRERSKLYSARQILLSIPGSSGLLIPYLRILGFSDLTFRSHNAELLHRWDWVKNSKSIRTTLKSIKKAFFGYFSDLFVSIFARRILSVSDKEIEIYWKVFFPWANAKVRYFPGASPLHVKRPSSYHEFQNRKRPYATIIGGFESETIISKADQLFIKNGIKIREFFNSMGLNLVSVGDNVYFDFCNFNFGYIDSYVEVLNNSEVIIVPTSKGWGFKTKIADAVTLHQSVVVTETLYNRLGFWSQMVSPVKDWDDVATLKLRTFSVSEYQKFLGEIMTFREKILKEVFDT